MYSLQELSTKYELVNQRVNMMENDLETYVKEQKDENTAFHNRAEAREEKMDKRMSRVEMYVWMGLGAIAALKLIETFINAHK